MRIGHRLVIIFAILLFVWPCWAETLYVRPITGEYGAEDGLTPETAFDGFLDISYGAGVGSLSSGDTLYVCGTFYTDDEGTFLNIQQSGADADNYIYIRGDYSGDPGVIDARNSIPSWDTSGNWTQDGAADRWHIDSAAWTYSDPDRMWFNGTEGQEVTSKANVDAANEWYYDSANTDVYVYATSNPASYYTAMTGLSTSSYAIVSVNYNYIDFSHLTLYGGQRTVHFRQNDYIMFHDNTVMYGYTGILVRGKTGVAYDDNTTNSKFYDNTIDSGYTLDNTESIVLTSSHGIEFTNGVDHCEISGNTITNWGHDGIQLGSLETGKWATGASDNKIYDNTVSAPDLEWGRPFDMFGQDGLVQNNKIYRNNFHDSPTRIQIGGNDNDFYSNIIDTISGAMRSGSTDADGGLQLSVWLYDGTTLVCKSNKIVNNTFYRTDEPAIRVVNSLAAEDTRLNTISNNAMYDCGYNAESLSYSIHVSNDTDVNNNTWENNCAYHSVRDTGNEVTYRGVAMTMSTFNTSDAQSDTIAGNIQNAPEFTDAANGDFTLQSTSPCINTGKDLGATYDDALDPNSSWPDNVITLDQDKYGSGNTHHPICTRGSSRMGMGIR